MITLTLACGGPPVSPDPSPVELPARYVAARIEVPSASLRSDPFESLAVEVASALTARGFGAQVISPAPGDPAWIGRVEVRTEGDDRHVILAADTSWDAAAIDAFLVATYTLPAEPAPNGQLTQSYVVSPEPVPFAVAYLHTGHWSAALEALLFSSFVELPSQAGSADAFVLSAAELLPQFGVDLSGSPREVAARIDQVLRLLPRPAESTDGFVPIATALALGLTLGEQARRIVPELSWVPGEESSAQYFALALDGEVALRPVDFMIDRYRSPIPMAAVAYVELVQARLAPRSHSAAAANRGEPTTGP